MSPRDLAESGVIGLDDVLQSELASLESETLKTSDSDTPGLANESPSTSERPVQLDTRCPEVDNMGILRELRELQVLEEQIKEEQLKLEALRCSEERLQSEEQSLDHVTTRSSRRERRMFLAQLEEEKREVEMMERSLSGEMEKAGSVRKRSSKGHRVVKCSVMERNSKLKDLDGDLLRNYRLHQQSPESAPHDPQQTDAEKPASHFILNAEECSSPNQAEDVSLTDSSLTPEPSSSTSWSVPTTSLSEIEIGGPGAPVSVLCAESLQDAQSCHGEPFVLSSTPDQKLEAMDSTEETNIHPELPESETSSCDCTGGDQVELETSEAPSTQKSCVVRDAFDPGGVVIAPVAAPRRDFTLDNQQIRPSSSERVESEISATSSKLEACTQSTSLDDPQTPPSASEPVESELSAATSKLEACTQSTSQGLHMQNNNNNTAVVYSDETPEVVGSSTAAPETQALPYRDDDSVTGRNCVSHDGGGSMRVVCRSPVNQLQLNTTRQVRSRVLTKEVRCIGDQMINIVHTLPICGS